MNFVLVNGSPHEHGSTDAALRLMAQELIDAGNHATVFWLGQRPALSCLGCGRCKETGHCFFTDDSANTLIDLARTADGFVFASPVHFCGVSGMLKTVMGRLFIAAPDALRHKPAVAVAVARRGGNVSALEEIEKFFTFNQMPIVSGDYWCIIHGACAGDIPKDEEGVHTLRTAARNLAYLTAACKTAAQNGIIPPSPAARPRTNFIR